MDAQHEITEQLAAVRGTDDPTAWERLVPLVYAELRAIAHRRLQRERDGHTLSTTALVHEAYLKLADQRHPQWRDRTHFFAIAAMVMRRVLVDYARSYQAARRTEAVPWEAADELLIDAATERAEIFVALDEALDRLSDVDERLARVVECRFFGGLTEDEIAAALGVTERTIRRDWARARAWLAHELEG
jgi:RNA polymerase sigma factor (TIGR02999 family)